MSAAPVSRAMALRSPRFIVRRTQFRNASTTSEVASKAKETASQTVSKASEGLSKVQASASEAASGAAASAEKAAGTGRIGRMVHTVNCGLREAWKSYLVTNSHAAMIPPTIYYSRVGMELAKLMFQGQKMAPPYDLISHTQGSC